MAITLDAQTVSSGTSDTDPVVFAHTVAAGATLLVVLAGTRGLMNHTGCTWDGNPMTQVRIDYENTLYAQTSIWYIVNPTSGSHNVSMDFSGLAVTFSVQAVSLFGTLTTAAVNHANNGTTDTVSGTSIDLTSTVDNCWMVEVVATRGNPATITQGAEAGRADWSPDWEYEPGGNEAAIGGTYYANVTPAGAKTFSWDWTGAGSFAMSAMAIGAAGVSASASVSPSSSLSPSASVSPSISPSLSPSVSPSASVSPSVSLSVSASISPSVSPSVSASASVSTSISLSASVSRSESPSVSFSVSPSISPSVSPSVSPSGAPLITGSVCWGHDTGVTESNIRDFAGNWTGTGSIEDAGDAEKICLEAGQYMESEVVDTGADMVTLLQNNYDITGDTVLLKYRHGNSEANCLLAAWNNYTIPFMSLGFVQIRIEFA